MVRGSCLSLSRVSKKHSKELPSFPRISLSDSHFVHTCLQSRADGAAIGSVSTPLQCMQPSQGLEQDMKTDKYPYSVVDPLRYILVLLSGNSSWVLCQLSVFLARFFFKGKDSRTSLFGRWGAEESTNNHHYFSCQIIYKKQEKRFSYPYP